MLSGSFDLYDSSSGDDFQEPRKKIKTNIMTTKKIANLGLDSEPELKISSKASSMMLSTTQQTSVDFEGFASDEDEPLTDLSSIGKISRLPADKDVIASHSALLESVKSSKGGSSKKLSRAAS